MSVPSPLSYVQASANDPWSTFLEQINRVTPHLGNYASRVDTLRHPKRCLIVDVPIYMHDGTVKHFEGYRVQHNISRGPGKGGLRYHPKVNLNEVMALAGWMSIKNAALNLPYGGAKGGIRVDPTSLTMLELERLTRRYTSEIGLIIGPTKDIPAPDVGTNEKIMAWMMDTYSVNNGATATGVVTGKPISLGGSEGRREATGRGVVTVAGETAQKLGFSLKGAKVIIQGFGNVGGVAGKLFVEEGAIVIAVQDHTGTIYAEKGLDVIALQAHVDKTRGVGGFEAVDKSVQTISPDAFWSLPCDIVVPAALEGQITSDNAKHIRAKMVIEGANGPTTPEADDILHDNGIMVVPDVLANAGGVTVSYFEWVQDFSSFFWDEAEINRHLVKIMKNAFNKIWTISQDKKISLRTATFVVACERILEARVVRGIYP
jgi:glutamate dehydrogenase (NAD(P)+)